MTRFRFSCPSAVALTVSAMLLAPSSASAQVELDREETVESAFELVVEEILALSAADAFTTHPILESINEFAVAEFDSRSDLLDFLDDAESDAESQLTVLLSADFELSAEAVSALTYSPDNVEDGVRAGVTAFVEPDVWLSGATDLLRRAGRAPEGTRDPGEYQLLVDLLDGWAMTGEYDLGDYADPAFAASNFMAPSTEQVDNEAATPADSESTSRSLLLGAVALLIALASGGWIMSRRGRNDNGFDERNHRGQHTRESPAGLVDVLEASRRMTAALDVKEIHQIAVDDAIRMTKADAGALAERTADGLRFVHTSHPTIVNDGTIHGGALRRLIETGQPTQLVSDDDPALAKLPMAMAATPIVVNGSVTATLVVLRTADRPFGLDAASALDLLAPVTGSALAAAAAHGTAVTAAEVDGLTNLHNRRRLDRDLAALEIEVPSTMASIGFAMVDVDHFKTFNDTNGHGAGDVALQAIASAISASVRNGDEVYRYGGEEFSVLLHSCSPTDAAEVMERVRESVEQLVVPGGENQPLGRLTISIGLALGPSDQAPRLPRQADDALYRAKDAGRNRVVISR